MGFDETHLIPLVDEGLGNSAYLVDLGDGRALAVDAPYDLRAVRAAADRRGLVIGFAAETHLHADFVSGARQLAATDGAKILASAAGGRRFEHVALADEDEVDLGGLTMRALATPGHTEEHLSFLLLDGDRPLGVFTGGSLIVGAAARTDLVDPGRTRRLARAQYESIQRLAALPAEVAVWPTHGAGSFCSAPPDDDRISTIGTERARNPLLRAPDGDAFADRLIAGLGSFPPYFLRLADVNRAGPAVLTGEPRPAFLGAAEVSAALAGGATPVDVRPIARFAAGHIPGSLSIALRPQFATWLGWLTEPDTPWVLVTDPGQDAGDAVWQALKIGHPAPLGHTTVEAWDGPLATLPLLRPDQLTGRQVLDVRQENEYAAGHLPGAVNVELGDLSGAPVGPEPYTVMCGHGERATTAASLLLRRGRGDVADVAVVAGGPEDWAEATGRPLVEGR
ncbi:MAG TPA: MBL fold metallo-hydrolase [Streptosporangiaceae bacterium]|nr:MBL fold metallo-hydrolase [Streptosporangiaceae bacterium]